MFTAGFLTLGSGVASADIAIGPVSVPTEAVNVRVASNSGSDAPGGQSDGGGGASSSGESSSDAPGPAANTQAAPLLQVPQQEEGGLLSGNTINGPNVNANISCNGIGVAGNASANCGEGSVPPPEEPPEEVPPPNGPPEEVPPPDEPPSQQRPGPGPGPEAEDEGEAMQEAGEQLPFTGSDTSSLLALAVGLLVAGVTCLAVSSHRIRLGRK